MARFEELRRQVRRRQSDQNENDDHGGKGERDRESVRRKKHRLGDLGGNFEFAALGRRGAE